MLPFIYCHLMLLFEFFKSSANSATQKMWIKLLNNVINCYILLWNKVLNGTVQTIWWCPLLCETSISSVEFWMLRWTKHLMPLLKISCYQHSTDQLHDVTTTKHPFQNTVVVLQVFWAINFIKKQSECPNPVYFERTPPHCVRNCRYISQISHQWCMTDLRKYVYRTLLDCTSSTMKHINSYNWCHCTQYCYYIHSVCTIEVL